MLERKLLNQFHQHLSLLRELFHRHCGAGQHWEPDDHGPPLRVGYCAPDSGCGGAFLFKLVTTFRQNLGEYWSLKVPFLIKKGLN